MGFADGEVSFEQLLAPLIGRVEALATANDALMMSLLAHEPSLAEVMEIHLTHLAEERRRFLPATSAHDFEAALRPVREWIDHIKELATRIPADRPGE